MNKWKWIGLAGVIGAAAVGAGVLISRRNREYVDYEDEQLRDRLHERLAQARERSNSTSHPS
jgi:ElaB/YqjD/DUF883 family membrane-anchored ribosome-binding protein